MQPDTNKSIRLSVIIPGYNTPKAWWRRCVQSVLAACGPTDEVICVDDGSFQPVSSFWSEINQGDSRTRLITLDCNSGQSIARNIALDSSRGEYVTFVDSDDEISTEIYDDTFHLINKHDADVTCFGVRVVWPDIALEKIDVLPTEYYGILDKFKFEMVMKSCLFEYPVNKIYRSLFLKKNNIKFRSRVCPGEDTVFNLQCIMANGSWCMSSNVGYVYYRPDGTTLSKYVPNLHESILKKKMEIWHEMEAKIGDRVGLLRKKFIFSEGMIYRFVWLNMWRRGSPELLGKRWRFLRQHPKVGMRPMIFEFIWRMLYSTLRIHCYWPFLRKYHMRRLYPNVHSVACRPRSHGNVNEDNL